MLTADKMRKRYIKKSKLIRNLYKMIISGSKDKGMSITVDMGDYEHFQVNDAIIFFKNLGYTVSDHTGTHRRSLEISWKEK